MNILKHRVGLIWGLVALSLVGVVAPRLAQAATFYIDAVNGNDSTAAFDPATSTKPYRTFSAVLYRARTYFSQFGVDTIIVEPGFYTDAFTVHQNGLTIKARYDATATKTQRSILRPSGPNVWQLISISASNVTVRGLELDGVNAYVNTGPTASGSGTKDTGITSQGNPTGAVQVNGQYTDSSNNLIPASTHVSVNHRFLHGDVQSENSGRDMAESGAVRFQRRNQSRHRCRARVQHRHQRRSRRRCRAFCACRALSHYGSNQK